MMSMEEQREMNRLKAVNEGLRRQIGMMKTEIYNKNNLIEKLKDDRAELHVKIEQLLARLVQS